MRFKMPFIEQVVNYKKQYVFSDLLGGLTVGVMLIPQGMAYAFLAGVPPIYGLYASIVPLLLYMLFGTSRFVTIGPAALISLLVLTGLDQLNITDPAEYLNAVFLIALIAGLIQFLMGILKLGYIINFISQPVLKGFILGAAFTIMLSQVKHIMGIDAESGGTLKTIASLFKNFNSSNFYTMGIGFAAIAFLLLMKRLSKRIPSQLIVVGLGMFVVGFFQLETNQVDILGVVPKGMPNFSTPEFDWMLVQSLLPVSATIALISFIEVYAIGVSLEDKDKAKNIIPNRELIALGLSKFIGGFFQAFPTSGSFSRSAVNKEAGSKTIISGFYTILLIVLTLLFLTPYFYYLPKAVLGAIIIVAIFGLIEPSYIRRLWITDKRDLLMFAATATATFFIGVQEGIITGVVLSIFLLAYNVSYPHIAETSLVKGTKSFRNVDRFKDTDVNESALIVRVDAPLTYSNIPHFLKKLKKFEEKKNNLQFVILNASAINNIDSTATEALKGIVKDYNDRDIRFVITNLRGPVRDKFKQSGVFESVGYGNFFSNDYEALKSCEGLDPDVDTDIVFQSNK
ncbi:MAG: sodium-independent anion transporter [Fluviicola sp.]|nr:MAG: sodium-independent anion transporter [Fluviicola sp.]